MIEDNKRPIIIKRIKKKSAHHGGAWKIAYADFVTAMMAFFMLMWLLSLLNKYQVEGVSKYFKKPLQEAFVGDKKNHIPPITKVDENGMPILQISDSKQKNPAEALEKNKSEAAQMEKLKEQLKKELETDPDTASFASRFDFQVVADGLRIRLSDLENNPMFSLGKADFAAHVDKVINWLSKEINKTSGKLTIIGYTDSKPYDDGSAYTNWELSADRANATRRVLIANGVDEDRVIRIQGSGDINLLDKINGENPVNRRIEIILLNTKAAKKMMGN